MGLSVVQIKEQMREAVALQMRTTADKLAAGRARDYAEYRQMVGQIQGGREALDAVDAVFHKLLDEGDE